MPSILSLIFWVLFLLCPCFLPFFLIESPVSYLKKEIVTNLKKKISENAPSCLSNHFFLSSLFLGKNTYEKAGELCASHSHWLERFLLKFKSHFSVATDQSWEMENSLEFASLKSLDKQVVNPKLDLIPSTSTNIKLIPQIGLATIHNLNQGSLKLWVPFSLGTRSALHEFSNWCPPQRFSSSADLHPI